MSLSFLDVMSCGFGAVVLIFLILDHQISEQQQTVTTDPNMVAEGKAGIYREEAVAPVPLDLRRRWFKKAPVEGSWEVADELRALVSFRELNLIGDWPMKGKFDAIFCRNVVIYFDEPTQERIWSRFAPLLEPRGTLYIGHSERVTGAATSLFETTGLTTYTLRSGR